MPDRISDYDLNSILDDLKKRVRDLEMAARINSDRVRISTVDGYMQIFSPEGRQVFAAGNLVSAAPPAYIGMTPTAIASVSTSFRPGTTSASYAEIWVGDFFAVGPDIFWQAWVFPNGGNMDWKITIQEAATGIETDVFTEAGLTSNTTASGVFTIPTACLTPATDTGILGRFYRLRFLAKRNSGAAQVDIAMIGMPYNFDSV